MFSATAQQEMQALTEHYQKLTQREHILKRPDSYSTFVIERLERVVGSVNTTTQRMWIYDDAKEAMVYKEMNVVRENIDHPP